MFKSRDFGIEVGMGIVSVELNLESIDDISVFRIWMIIVGFLVVIVYVENYRVY